MFLKIRTLWMILHPKWNYASHINLHRHSVWDLSVLWCWNCCLLRKYGWFDYFILLLTLHRSTCQNKIISYSKYESDKEYFLSIFLNWQEISLSVPASPSVLQTVNSNRKKSVYMSQACKCFQGITPLFIDLNARLDL